MADADSQMDQRHTRATKVPFYGHGEDYGQNPRLCYETDSLASEEVFSDLLDGS